MLIKQRDMCFRVDGSAFPNEKYTYTVGGTLIALMMSAGFHIGRLMYRSWRHQCARIVFSSRPVDR